MTLYIMFIASNCYNMIIVRPCSYDVDECDGETTAYNNSIDCNCELVNGPNNTCEGM